MCKRHVGARVGVHVRHGDKKVEMKLEKTAKYVEAVEALLKGGAATAEGGEARAGLRKCVHY